MRVWLLASNHLYSFLKSVLPYSSFTMYMHVLTEPYVSLLASLPKPVVESSEVYLDGEKRGVNDYAVRRLRAAGYAVYYVNRLHGKVVVVGSRPDYIIVGTSNLTARSFSNYELVVVIESPSEEVYRAYVEYFARAVKRDAYKPL